MREHISALLALVAPLALVAQAPRIIVGPAVHISAPHAKNPHAETFLAINPRDQRNLVAVSMVGGEGRRLNCCVAIYASFDNGRTWVESAVPPGDTTILNGADPISFFDGAGVAYYARYGTDGVVVSRSTDGGRTWTLRGMVSVSPFDRPFMVVDETTGPFRGRMYAAGNMGGPYTAGLDGSRFRNIGLSTSTDTGRTFQKTALVAPGPGNEQTFVPGDLLVLRDGTLIVPFTTYTKRVGQPAEFGGDGHVAFAVSRDGGKTFAAVRLGPTKRWGPGPGQTWQVSSAPRAALDRSDGPFKGRLYFTWADYEESRKQYVIRTAYTADTGLTWSVPVIVHDDSSKKGTMSNPVIAVSPQGIVGVAWNDSRDDPTDQCYRLYFAASTNGGVSYLPNVAGSDRPSCGRALGNWQPTGSSDTIPLDRSTLRPRRTIRVNAGMAGSLALSGGHTMGMVADSANTFHVAWSSGSTGTAQFFAQRFLVTAAPPAVAAADSRRVDLTTQVAFIMTQPVISAADHTVSVTVQLKNTSKAPVAGPLTLVLDEMESTGFRDLQVRNADNKVAGRGATWELDLRGTTQLMPGEATAPRVLTWTFGQARDWPTTAGAAPVQPLRASFVVLGARGDR